MTCSLGWSYSLQRPEVLGFHVGEIHVGRDHENPLEAHAK